MTTQIHATHSQPAARNPHRALALAVIAQAVREARGEQVYVPYEPANGRNYRAEHAVQRDAVRRAARVFLLSEDCERWCDLSVIDHRSVLHAARMGATPDTGTVLEARGVDAVEVA